MTALASPLNDILGTRSKVSVLRELVRRDEPVTGREAARLAHLSHGSAQDALQELLELGVVRRREGGRAHLYRLNREHYLVQHALEALFRTERRSIQELFDRLQKALSTAAQESGIEIVSAMIFGSVARGEDRPDSDLDLLIVHALDGGDDRPLREELPGALEPIESLFGHTIAPVVVSSGELREMEAREAPLAVDARDEGRRVYGTYVDEIVDG